MARKIKKPKPPPLSVTDGALYLLFFLLCFAWMVSSYFVYHHFQAMIAGADSGARMWNNYKTEWGWMVFPVCSAMAGAFIFAIWYPTPLFGNPKVRYGQYPYHEYAPLFSRTLPLREHQPELFAHKRRQTLIALAAFVLALLLGLPGLCPRDVLMEDGSIAHHDTLNRCTETVLPDDIRSVTFTTRHRELSKSGTYWDFYVAANGYVFNSGNFIGADADGLRFLLQFRKDMERRGVPIQFASDDPDTHLSPRELLPMIAADLGYDSEETALLYELFDGA